MKNPYTLIIIGFIIIINVLYVIGLLVMDNNQQKRCSELLDLERSGYQYPLTEEGNKIKKIVRDLCDTPM